MLKGLSILAAYTIFWRSLSIKEINRGRLVLLLVRVEL